MAKRIIRDVDLSQFGDDSGEFTDRSVNRDGDGGGDGGLDSGVGADGRGSGGIGGSGGGDERSAERSDESNSDGDQPEYTPAIGADAPPIPVTSGGRIRFSVGGNNHGGDGGTRTGAGKDGSTGSVRRSRKAARQTLAAGDHEQAGTESVGKGKSKAAGGKKLTQTEAAEVAEGLLDMGGFVVAKIVENDDANFTDDEKDDILPGLTRIMLRMSPAAAKRYRDLTDPFMLILAFYFYAARVMPMYQETRYRKAYERQQYIEQYGNPGYRESVSDVDNDQPPPNPKNGGDRRGSILR